MSQPDFDISRHTAGFEGDLAGRPVVLIGAGNLAWSLARGLLQSGRLPAGQLRVTNRSDDLRLARFAGLGLACGRDRASLLAGAGTIILLVKPQDAVTALGELTPHLPVGGVLLISAVAGLSLAQLRARLGAGISLLRAMPNTSAQVGSAATAIAAAPGTGDAEIAWARSLLESVGTVHSVDESQLDAVTAVSGSGPAYFYYFTESLIAAARSAGLDEQLARALALETLQGAALMLAHTGADPAVLRAQVTSVRGTTEAGLMAMARGRLSEAVLEGVLQAQQRSRELSFGFDAAPAGREGRPDGSS